MTDQNDKLPSDIPPPAGQRPDRRRAGNRAPPKVHPGAVGSIDHDALGNAVWTWRVDVPRRREDDPTIDLLECLDVDGLSIEEDEKAPAPAEQSFNPYDKIR